MKQFKTVKDFNNLRKGDLIIAVIPECEPLTYRYIEPDSLEEDKIILAYIDGSNKSSYEKSFIMEPCPYWYYDVSLLDLHTLLKEFYEKQLANSIRVLKENKGNHTRINFENTKHYENRIRKEIK